MIGAGLAVLHRAGWKVTVLEARPRVGGRVHSIRGFAHAQVAEGSGEHVSVLQGFMEGAVESGQRAARLILAS